MIQVVVQVPAPPPIPPIPDMVMLPPWMTLPPPVVTLISIAFIAGVALVLFPIARALARRVEGRGGAADLVPQLEDLRERVRDLEGVQLRVAELEERLDFTERLLTQRRDEQALAREGGR
jgi:hypothetical protein